MVVPKVRRLLDGLPFSENGYIRAKDILCEKYGRPSEVAIAHIQEIIGLPTITNQQQQPLPLKKIHEFYEKLVTNVQALDTMGKLDDIKGYVRLTLDKLPSIRADLVRNDDDYWQEWNFMELVKALRKWTDRNPLNSSNNFSAPLNMPSQGYRRDKLLHASQKEIRVCVYCDQAADHKSTNCPSVVSVEDRRRIISSKRLCFNCLGQKHRTSECRSKQSCQNCELRHHTSICATKTSPNLSVSEENVIYPLVLVKVNGIKCRALIDSGSGSTYASTTLISSLNQKPSRVETKRIEMMLHISNTKMNIYECDISDIGEKFVLKREEICKINKSVLITVSNPDYDKLSRKYSHLKDVKVHDVDAAAKELPVHLIIGTNINAKIKTRTPCRIGRLGEPVAELTKFGWTVTSPGQEASTIVNQLLLTKSTVDDYKELCSSDVLGLSDSHIVVDDSVLCRFKKQLKQSDEGWYETDLLFKSDDSKIGTNKAGSLGRLKNLISNKLEKNPKLFEEYDAVIQEHKRLGYIEEVTCDAVGKEFYLPHRPVVRTNAESTKVRIVFDASAKEKGSQSLNDILETGPPMQNLLFDILVRSRFAPVMLCADVKQAFLQIRVRESFRDVLRFHWIKDKNPNMVEVYRYTRPLFGLVQSPFLLNGTIDAHLERIKEQHPERSEFIDHIKEDIYVDDFAGGDIDVKNAIKLKNDLVETFNGAGYTLHKWHSNRVELENDEPFDENVHMSYAKETLGNKYDHNETKILGLVWDKLTDCIGVSISKGESQIKTKREILKFLASVFDPLGIFSSVMLIGKSFYRDACELGISWDEKLPDVLIKRFERWFSSLPEKCEIRRTLAPFEEKILKIDLHVFCDASIKGVCAVVYAVVNQASGSTKGILVSKSRLAKKNQTIPQLELIAVHMGANLMSNVREILKRYPVKGTYGLTDSTVVLYWLKNEEQYKQFVSNRVTKLKEKQYISWRHVPTSQNPADYGSRGCTGNNQPAIWFDGPCWLEDPNNWLKDIVTKGSFDSSKEIKQIKSVIVAVAVEDAKVSAFDSVLEKVTLSKYLRIMSWISRFLKNCRKMIVRGPLTTNEIEQQLIWIVKMAQLHNVSEEYQASLNLQINEKGLYECRGRIQGDYPLFIPSKHLLAEKIVGQAHEDTLHGGVGLTMTKVRERFWIPKLRQLVKCIRYKCYGCKRFHATSFANPPPGRLPDDRTKASRAFNVIGVDFAGPIYFRAKNKKEGKAFILLFSCSLSRAVHLELLTDQTADSFIRCLKRFVARRGRPRKIYSDNAKAFKCVAKWLFELMKSEKLNDYIISQEISWQFNLSRAPWWGGQFERLVGLVKQSLYKTIGKALLTFYELEEVLLDVEQTLNNRPLSYVEDDIQLPILTPNALILGEINLIPTKKRKAIKSRRETYEQDLDT